MNTNEKNTESTTATDPLADIAFSVRQIPARTDGFMDESSRDDPGRTHWKYTLQRGSHKLSGEYSQGSAHRVWSKHARYRLRNDPCTKQMRFQGRPYEAGTPAYPGGCPKSVWVNIMLPHTEPRKPTLQDILSCLIMDADGADALTFEEWCSELGYSDDSREAERIFNECRRIAVLLQRILPREHWAMYRDA